MNKDQKKEKWKMGRVGDKKDAGGEREDRRWKGG